MKIFYYFGIILALLVATRLPAQTRPSAFPSVLDNHRTDKYVQFPHSGLFLLLTSGFLPSDTFNGFIKKEGTTLAFLGGEGLNYYELAYTSPAFNRDSLTAMGAHVLSLKNLRVNGVSGKYVEFQMGDRTISALLFGDSSFRVSLTGTALSADDSSRSEIRSALSSVIYDRSAIGDPYEGAPFHIDETKSVFREKSRLNDTWYYTLPGKLSPDAPVALIKAYTNLLHPSDTTAAGNFHLMTEQLGQFGIENPSILQFQHYKLNDIYCFEVQLQCDLYGRPGKVYQLLLRKADKAVYFQGICDVEEFEKYLPAFKAFAGTIELK